MDNMDNNNIGYWQRMEGLYHTFMKIKQKMVLLSKGIVS